LQLDQAIEVDLLPVSGFVQLVDEVCFSFLKGGDDETGGNSFQGIGVDVACPFLSDEGGEELSEDAAMAQEFLKPFIVFVLHGELSVETMRAGGS
jgi:hypothetical protein